MPFDNNIQLDVELKKLLESFYNYLHIKIYVAPSNYQCPICKNDTNFGCIRFSKDTCYYSEEMEKEHGKLENKLNTWLKTNDKNYNKVKSLGDKAQKDFKNLEAKWISEEDFANKYPFEEMLVLEGVPEEDEDGFVSGLKTVEVKRKVPYQHYEYQLLYHKFKEKCYSCANKVEHLIFVRLQNIPLPEKLIGFDTTINNCSLDDIRPAYDTLKDNGFIVQGNLQDFFNIFTRLVTL